METIVIAIFGLGGTELVIIGIIVLLLFGGRKIPQLMKGFGQGIREFKRSSSEGDDESLNLK
ncbi:MAG TPA: twin-arginine translocase TatA/TatE family subunit [Bacteroidia bacterium]|jgi:sec-independent protein translocase protein TatA|nr:twin-arginine translocase TatA/TatE family subunit [Bacteroidia bacterium]